MFDTPIIFRHQEFLDMPTLRKEIDTISRKDYTITIVECWNEVAGQVYGAFITKNGNNAFLCGGYRTRPDCTEYWDNLCKEADHIARFI